MKSIYKVLCVLGLLSLASATKVSECSQGGLVPDEVHIEGCESEADLFCSVPFNGYINMTMKLTSPHYLESIKPQLIGKTVLGNINLSLGSDRLDACTVITNSVCPIVANEVIEFKYNIRFIVMPLLTVTLEFSIIDEDLDEAVVCFSLDVFPVKL
ncbi:hypothetical protein NQ318_020576 [Aromia moschata]|uniref:MD-2-related lipid-recognition domain-containing protein n=1 Tax=Aromia moschata TaxID=1265417 RepID=A0AAV8Z2F8_9CUCU|nr:hypothetical protein NQ318_020576 [Aromia moschata]